jgi:hypothetical protein
MPTASIRPHSAPEARSNDWADELLSDSKAVVVRLMCEPLISPDGLRLRTEAHRDELTRNAGLLTDVPLARAIAHRLIQMLDGVETPINPTHHRMIQVAVRYYELEPDEDLASPFGLEDDVEVMNAVAEALDRRDLLLPA